MQSITSYLSNEQVGEGINSVANWPNEALDRVSYALQRGIDAVSERTERTPSAVRIHRSTTAMLWTNVIVAIVFLLCVPSAFMAMEEQPEDVGAVAVTGVKGMCPVAYADAFGAGVCPVEDHLDSFAAFEDVMTAGTGAGMVGLTPHVAKVVGTKAAAPEKVVCGPRSVGLTSPRLVPFIIAFAAGGLLNLSGFLAIPSF